MKKTVQKCAALLAVLFAASGFAATTGHAHTTIQPIDEALSQHKLVGGPGQGTDIVVINYTEGNVRVCSPYSCNVLTRLTSERITADSYSDMPINLADYGSGIVFWNDYVPSYATISIYVSGGRYVVYKTKN